MHLTEQARDHLARRLHEERERVVGELAKIGKQLSAADAYNQALNAVETGRTVPSTAVALQLSRALGRPLEELFDPPVRHDHNLPDPTDEDEEGSDAR